MTHVNFDTPGITRRHGRSGPVEHAEGLPGLVRRGGAWRIETTRRGRLYRFSLGVYSLEAARALYAQWELDPDGVEARSERPAAPGGSLGLLEVYVEGLRLRGYSAGYLQEITRIGREFLAVVGGSRKVSTYRRRDVESWLATLETRGLASRSVKGYLVRLRGWSRWLLEEEHTTHDWAGGIEIRLDAPRSEQRTRIVPLEAALAVAGYMRAKGWGADADTVLALWSTGLRWSELGRVHGVDVGPAELRVRSAKADGRSRRVPITDPEARAALVRIAQRNAAKRRGIDRGLHTRRLMDACAAVGTPRFSPHALRHTAATRWAEEGCQVLDIARWLGHRSPTTTVRYQSEERAAVQLPRAVIPG